MRQPESWIVMVERKQSIEELLTYEQAGKLLGVTSRTVWTLVDRGDLTAVRFGSSVRIDPVDLRAFINRAKTATATNKQDDRFRK